MCKINLSKPEIERVTKEHGKLKTTKDFTFADWSKLNAATKQEILKNSSNDYTNYVNQSHS